MNKKAFKSESKQFLNLMINSIYSNKDIFLRELISNASDALDKKEFLKIQGKIKATSESCIIVKTDKKLRTVTITDTGIGMNEKELDENLGTIAHSGSKEFLSKLENTKDLDVIGQFGVGFYSSFIVADHVEVISKKENSSAFLWESDGIEDYSVTKHDSKEIGTTITLFIKKGKEFDKFLDETEIKTLIIEHSDFVKFPIKMKNEEQELEVINSQKAIWKKDKRSIKKEEYNEFYAAKYYDFMPPAKVIHAKSEGIANLDMLLFIPSKKPFDFYTPNFKKGLALYSRGVLIDDPVDYLIPDYFSFIRGVVDSEDLSLNISREMLQQDRTVEKMKKVIKTKIRKELEKMLKKDREAYITLFEEFGRTLTYGIYDQYGAAKDELKDLLIFKNSLDKEYVTLSEYVEKFKDSEFIYYVSGESIEKIDALPIMKKIADKEIPVLYFINDIDEFAIQLLAEYNGKQFKSITQADFNTDEEKKEIEKLSTSKKDVLDKIKKALDGKVIDVHLTTKIGDIPSTLINDNGISIEQEKLLAQVPGNDFQANKILEINPDNDVFKLIDDNEDLEAYAKLLYYQAQILDGLTLDNPIEYIELTNKLIIK